LPRKTARSPTTGAPTGAAGALVGQSRLDWVIICDLARRMEAELGIEHSAGFDYPDAEAIWEEMRRVTPSFYGITYARLDRESGVHWPCPAPDHPGTPYLFADDFPRGQGKFWALEYGTKASCRRRIPVSLSRGACCFTGMARLHRLEARDIFPDPCSKSIPTTPAPWT